MRELLYFGWLGHQNVGDEALLEVNKRIFKEFKFVIQASAEEYNKDDGDKTLLEVDKRVFKEFKRSPECREYNQKACIIGGGTFINQYVNVAPMVEIQTHMPLIIFGAGVRNPAFWETTPRFIRAEKEWNEILGKCPFVGVRGPHSMKTLYRQGFNGARLIGDPVLSLAEEMVRPKEKSKRVGINFGYNKERLWGGNDKKVIDFYRLLIRMLLNLNFEVSLFSVYPPDTEVLRKISGEFGGLELHVYYDYTPDIFDYFHSLDIFIGQKLHSVILAHCAYTPAIMLEYRPKCADYMASMDLEDYNFRCDRLDLNVVMDAFDDIMKRSTDYQAQLFEKISKYKQIQREFADEIITYLRQL